MHPLHRLEVENFLSLQDVKVDLGPLNVLVGPNGAGKSNLLKVLKFLGDVARQDLWPALRLAGGYRSVAFRGIHSPPAPIRISLEGQFSDSASSSEVDTYSLAFDLSNPLSPSYEAANIASPPDSLERLDLLRLARREKLSFAQATSGIESVRVDGPWMNIGSATEKSRSIAVALDSTALSILPRLGDDSDSGRVRQLGRLFETLRLLEIDIEAARLPSPSRKRTQLTASAANLAGFLSYLSEEHAKSFEDLKADLVQMIPGVKGLHVRRVGGSEIGSVVELIETGFSDYTPLGAASLGTIRALALLAMLHDPNPPKLTCVEEIDHGLHPHALDVVVDRLREASKRTQLLVVTHSPVLVNRLEPEELIVCERDPDTGASRIPAIDSKTVREMEKAAGDLRLGELWFSGVLGGVPA